MRVNRELRVPLYLQVYERILTMIREEQWVEGQLLPSERELSETFGVNRLTVRRALEMISKEGLVEKIPGVGTRVITPIPPLSVQGNSHCLVFLLPKVPRNIASGDRITEPFNASLFYSIENECKKRGYSLIYTTLDEDESLAEILKNREVTGIFFVSRISEKYLQEAKHINTPAVIINNDGEFFPTIIPDRETGTYEAVEYLISLNHRRIAFISGIPDYFTSIACYRGYQAALRDHCLEVDESLIKEGDWTFYGGFNAMKEIIEEQTELPTAVFACNDMTAIGAMEAIRSHGLSVPQDISVIGFDNIEHSRYCNPTLTTVDVDTALIAQVAAHSLFFSIENKQSQPVKVTIPVRLIKRQSTAYCPKARAYVIAK